MLRESEYDPLLHKTKQDTKHAARHFQVRRLKWTTNFSSKIAQYLTFGFSGIYPQRQ